MQDIMSKLQEILSTKEGQNQLNSIASMLNPNGGGNQNSTPPPQNSQNTEPPENNSQGQGFDLSSLASMFSNMNSTSEQPTQSQEDTSSGGLPNIDMNLLMSLQSAFSSMGSNDKNSQLLLALKPHFSEKRQEKVDKAMKIMNLISLWPILKDSGVLKGFI